MPSTAMKHPLALGLVLAAALACVGGATAAIAWRVVETGHPAVALPNRSVPAIHTTSSATTAPATTATKRPARAAAATTGHSRGRAVGPVTASQAIAIAERQTHAKVAKLEAEASSTGVNYEVKLVRADGSDVEVLVIGRTGQVVAERDQ